METLLSNDGTRLAYARAGAGPSLVLVHGSNLDHTSWDAVLPALQTRWSVYALDRRGRGRSGDSSAYAIEREFEDVAALVNAVPGPVVLVGHSFGGICALGAALLTRNVDKLIVYEPPLTPMESFGPVDIIPRLEALAREGRLAETLETFLRDIGGADEATVQHLKAQPQWNALVASAHTLAREGRVVAEAWRSLARYAEVRVPTLLMYGELSPPYCAQVARNLQGVLPRSHITVLPGQGHFAMNEAPERFVRELLAFTGGLE
ncbi:alpha/beta fold hydrolase [Stigmatella erecta]|uniref:Pimeloyl-ACP methyl ester carboxylesterase n=1 Tax=Stigmatella erecta TaxID=83460 RepID=A0A1I0L4E5_9BACT|nr:alpha/beta hydrolase [Stigmatella erecta]SEU34110.1 Pimeloyl-ACP methyl ester carboxylesterase [Stigmatella erecta]